MAGGEGSGPAPCPPSAPPSPTPPTGDTQRPRAGWWTREVQLKPLWGKTHQKKKRRNLVIQMGIKGTSPVDLNTIDVSTYLYKGFLTQAKLVNLCANLNLLPPVTNGVGYSSKTNLAHYVSKNKLLNDCVPLECEAWLPAVPPAPTGLWAPNIGRWGWHIQSGVWHKPCIQGWTG